VQEAGLWGVDQELSFPVVVKSGVNAAGRAIRYYFNYSDGPVSFPYPHTSGRELLSDRPVAEGERLEIEPWGVRIIMV
jgi:beta-galactosidase